MGARGDAFSTDALNGAALTPAVGRHVCAATYATNAASTNACPAGYSKITDITTCRAAAKALGTTYAGGNSLSTKPSGCYRSTVTQAATSFVYLNTDATGAADRDSQPVCKVTGTPPQPPRRTPPG